MLADILEQERTRKHQFRNKPPPGITFVKEGKKQSHQGPIKPGWASCSLPKHERRGHLKGSLNAIKIWCGTAGTKTGRHGCIQSRWDVGASQPNQPGSWWPPLLTRQQDSVMVKGRKTLGSVVSIWWHNLLAKGSSHRKMTEGEASNDVRYHFIIFIYTLFAKIVQPYKQAQQNGFFVKKFFFN